MDDLLDAFREFGAIRQKDGDVLRVAKQEAVPPTYSGGGIFNSFSPSLKQALSEIGLDSLYDHQERAVYEALIRGHNVVLNAPTASGKSLAFQIPMIEALLRDPTAHALMIYPMNALVVDQQQQLNRLLAKIPGRPINSDLFIGSTSEMQRDVIKENPPRILITNPEMLHYSLMGWSEQWYDFLNRLKWIVIDEVHTYRGYFGSSVSMILRRFSHMLGRFDVNPQFFLSSATCANAQEHAQQLTGLEFTEIRSADAMKPERTYWFLRPATQDKGYWEDLIQRTVSAGLACLVRDKAVLVFCPTRKFAESCHRHTLLRMKENGLRQFDGLDENSVKVYRSGLSDAERRAVQRGLQDGTVKLVFTTNALELGLDIGGLDGVVMAGFPDNLMSAWQQIGRAGRRWNSEAFVFFIARNDPLDRFFASDPEAFLHRPLLDLVVNPANEVLIERHVPCLIYESNAELRNQAVLGQEFADAATKLIATGAKIRRKGNSRPHFNVNVRGPREGSFTLKKGAEEIGTISRNSQFREAFQEAIYLHGGDVYRVTGIASAKDDSGVIKLEDAPANLRTDPHITTHLSDADLYAGQRWEHATRGVEAVHGSVRVTEELRRVDEIDEKNNRLLRHWEPEFDTSLPSWAHAFWIGIDGRRSRVRKGLTALQNILRVGVIFTIPIDTHDMFAHSIAQDQTIYIVESYPGGIGVAQKVLERWRDCLVAGIKVAEACDCKIGCANCIVPPRFKGGQPDKRDGIILARDLIKATTDPHTHHWDRDLWRPAD